MDSFLIHSENCFFSFNFYTKIRAKIRAGLHTLYLKAITNHKLSEQMREKFTRILYS